MDRLAGRLQWLGRDFGPTGGRLMKIGVPRETYPGERRVALVPAVIPGL